MDVQLLHSDSIYLSTELIKQCFEDGKIHYVDKVVTGNGFTTGFAKLKPKRGKINILIAPNQSVVRDKKQDYENGGFGYEDAKIGFVFENNGLERSVDYYDIIVFVSDSFTFYSERLKGLVDKVLLDEYHTVEIQSLFRVRLKKMLKILNQDYKSSSVTFVTASPNYFSRVTIKIVNGNIKERKLHLCNNPTETISRIVDCIKAGERVLIFTQEANIVQLILSISDRNDFKLTSGTSFKTTLLSKSKYYLNEKSNIHIVSSTGFEGWSDYSMNSNIFVFVNKALERAAFLGSNIYQAIGRTRNGFKYAEVCVRSLVRGGFGNVKHINSLEGKIEKLLSIKFDPNEKKQSPEYEFYYKGDRVLVKEIKNCLYFELNESGELLVEAFEPAIMIYKELEIYSISLRQYEVFFKERKIELINITDREIQKIKGFRVSEQARINNIVHSIKNNDCEAILLDFFFKSSYIKNRDLSLMENNKKALSFYIKELSILSKVVELSNMPVISGVESLLNFYLIPNLYNELAIISLERKKMKGTSIRDMEESRRNFKSIGFLNCLKLAKELVFNNISHNYIGGRDYNTTVTVSIKLIEYISERLELILIECDIKNAFPRIIYALCGMGLPVSFYGNELKERDRVKKQINTAINDIQFKPNSRTEKKHQKQNSKRRLEKLGFNIKVVDYLLFHWFDTLFKSSLFYFLINHERLIIKDVTDLIKSYNNNCDLLIVRRHDSVLLFHKGNKYLNLSCINNYMFLGVGGFFDEQKDFIAADLNSEKKYI